MYMLSSVCVLQPSTVVVTAFQAPKPFTPFAHPFRCLLTDLFACSLACLPSLLSLYLLSVDQLAL